MSNPDLDEIFFNKHVPPTVSPTPNLTFSIHNPASSNLRLHRQQSPSENQILNSLANDPNEDPNSPHIPIMPFKKMHTTKVKHHRPKFERGRRACSEPPTARTELANLADGNIDNTNKAANDELDKLEAKLTSPGEN